MEIRIIEKSGSHLLIARGERFAIVEKRNRRLYNCHDSARASIAEHDLSAIDRIVDEDDWVDEAMSRAAFHEVISRGNTLARGMR